MTALRSCQEGHYYGAQTELAVRNFSVCGRTLGDQPELLTAIAQVKKAAALANQDAGVLSESVAAAITAAADEISDGVLGAEQFPVDLLSGGGGVAPNMNVNEVIARRANELLGGRGYEFVHPNNHVNAGQSTSDTMATAVQVAIHRSVHVLRQAVDRLGDRLDYTIGEHGHQVKVARTCLQNAIPITFGQAFGAYAEMARRSARRLAKAADACLYVPMGGTVVGTGLGASAGYLERIYPRLRQSTGLPLRRHPNFFDAMQNVDELQQVSTTFRTLACGLAKMGRDFRILSGLDEIWFLTVQAGSSAIPGKANPVMAELLVQAALQVCGNDMVVTMAVESAELDFNVWTPLIVKNLFESAGLLAKAVSLFTDRCLRGLEVNAEGSRRTAETSLGLSSVVSGVYGYETGARTAEHAAATGGSIANALVSLGIASPATAKRLFDLEALTDPARNATLFDRRDSQRVS